MPNEPDADDEQAQQALDDLNAWRYRRARRYGLDRTDARVFANSDAAVSELRALVEAGCPVSLAARILSPL